jgi:hypothetical protein
MVDKNEESKKLWAISLNSIVIEYFSVNLPSFVLMNETSHGPYWGVTYSAGDLEIKIGGDVGFSVDIIIDKKKYSLWQYDRRVNNATETNNENIFYQLNVLKRFLSETI